MRDEAYPAQNASYVVFTSLGDDKRSERLLRQEVNTVVPAVPKYMHWSERPISQTREDHHAIMLNPGGYALVLDPTIVAARCTCKFSRVLIDGGSSINILYRDTMIKLGLEAKDLEPSRAVFHGIVLGLSCSPIGRIRLDVLFGMSNHFRREPIWFEVVDLSSAYHALLGRPAFAKFMAVPHYAYLKMKLPGTKGLITTVGNPARDSSLRSSSGDSLDSKAMASESPPMAHSPKAKGDAEVLSRRTFPGQGEVQEATRAAPEDDPSAAGHLGEKAPMETGDGGHIQFDPQPDTIPETHTVPKSSEQPPPKGGGVPIPPVTSIRWRRITKQHLMLLDDLKATFANLREYQIKLNPEKCVFGVPARKLLGFLVLEHGIEANPEKIKAIERMRKPTRLRNWNDQADEAFQDLKRMLSTAPVLAAPAEKEPLLLYIATTSRSVSVVLVVERPEKGKIQSVQCPFYYLSEVLSASKKNYPHYKKMCYGVYFTAKKLKRYFKEHIVTVVSTAPIGEIMGCRDASGRVVKWAIELVGHTMHYEPRTTIKSQALADFLVDSTGTQYLPSSPNSTNWRMQFDGSKMRSGLGANIVLSSPKGDRLRYALQIYFAASDNVTEYEAPVHDPGLPRNSASDASYAMQLSGTFNGCEFLHVPRAGNEAADMLAKIGSSRQAILPGVSLGHLHKPSVKPSPNSESIFIPDDPAVPLPNPDPGEAGALAEYHSVSGVRLDLASGAHPQSNGQVKRANGLILSGIEPRLVKPLTHSHGSWLDEPPAILWTLRTTPNRSTGFTLFFLVYEEEAVIPSDFEFDSPRLTIYTEAQAKEAREDGVDLLEEAHFLALSRSAIYQQGLRHYHIKKIKPLAFREGDLVLRVQ
ncbi:uncharacterized protein [Aegilops tauschii subsp. strangulata]|uniref:uncharacterized protein n=1 Tax=Aegilops tauschii subsp. strangulata TaxID=200361 RepID=UPI003CC8B6FC